MTSLLLPHLSSSLTISLASLNLLWHSKADARFMQDPPKAIWSIPYVSVASFFPSLKQNFIVYRSSKVSSRPDCIYEIHQLWQSGFSRVYSNSWCSCLFEREIIKICQSFYIMYSNNIVNFQEFTIILNARTKKSQETYRMPLLYDTSNPQPRYYVHLRAYTLDKGIKAAHIPLQFFCKGWFGIK